ncbi:MAG: hypothetical protein KGL53_06630, partial [Elusimicrobia bacterium]|nr:hypothetical protein [Elusimicrobiota bacterium]
MTTPTPLARAVFRSCAALALGLLFAGSASAASGWKVVQTSHLGKAYVFYYPADEAPVVTQTGVKVLRLFRARSTKTRVRSYLFARKGESRYRLRLVDEKGRALIPAGTQYSVSDAPVSAPGQQRSAPPPAGVDPQVWAEVQGSYGSLPPADQKALADVLTAAKKQSPEKYGAVQGWLAASPDNVKSVIADVR